MTRGCLTHWQDAPSSLTSTADYLYDGEGNRVYAQTSDSAGTSTTTAYVSNLEDVATSGGATTTTAYYYLAGKRVALSVNGALSYLLDDGLGSANEALDASGTATASQLYDPYGSVRYQSGSMPGTFGYTGQRDDTATTGLDYYGARYYDPVIGQFASADTVADGLNRYAYVGGNPETKVDPTGHDGLFSAIVSVVQAAAPVALQVVGTVTGVTSMISDVQTIANTIQHGGDPLTTALAVGDLALNVAMDVSMVTGVGEVAMGLHAAAEIGEHVAADAAEHAAADTIEHAAADEAEHAAEDGASDAMKGASGECPLSFAAGTLVTTTAGLKPIASLKTGDQVTAYDPKAKGTSTQTVQATWVTTDTDLLDVTLRPTPAKGAASSTSKTRQAAVASHGSQAPPSAGANKSIASTANAAAQTSDETISTTANHPWLTADRGWAQAGTLTIGEQVQRADGSTATVVALRDVAGTAPMYDLTVSTVHDFAVGDGAYVVHNCGGDPALNDYADAIHSSVEEILGPDAASARGPFRVSVARVLDGGSEKMLVSANKSFMITQNADTILAKAAQSILPDGERYVARSLTNPLGNEGSCGDSETY